MWIGKQSTFPCMIPHPKTVVNRISRVKQHCNLVKKTMIGIAVAWRTIFLEWAVFYKRTLCPGTLKELQVGSLFLGGINELLNEQSSPGNK